MYAVARKIARNAPPTVGVLSVVNRDAAVDTMVLAFAADPIARWWWPEPQQYLASMPGFTRAFGGAAFGYGTAHCTADGAGAALWLAPGIEPDEAELLATVETTVAPALRDDVLAMVEAMGSHHPDEPHWYLPMIGVEPARQGRGHGAALLRHQLARCDAEGTLAYLESSNPRNIGLYLRHGFEITGAIQVGSSPVMTPMLRRPR